MKNHAIRAEWIIFLTTTRESKTSAANAIPQAIKQHSGYAFHGKCRACFVCRADKNKKEMLKKTRRERIKEISVTFRQKNQHRG